MGEREVFVRFVTANGEDIARKFFRSAQNGIKCEGGKNKTKDRINISYNIIFKIILNTKIINWNFLIFQIMLLRLFTSCCID